MATILTHVCKGDGYALPNTKSGRQIVMNFEIDCSDTNVAATNIVKLMVVPAKVMIQDVIVNVTTAEGGTLTLDIHDDEFVIHALDQEVADGVLTGVMQRRVAHMWGGTGEVTQPSIETGEDD